MNYYRQEPSEILYKDYVSAYIQKKYIEDHFNWITVFVSDGTLIGKGEIKLVGSKRKSYPIILQYDPNSNRIRKEDVFILDDNIKFGKTPHLYNDNSLCLYYPYDISPFTKLSFVDVIPWITKWLISYELWEKYGIWLDKEIKH